MNNGDFAKNMFGDFMEYVWDIWMKTIENYEMEDFNNGI